MIDTDIACCDCAHWDPYSPEDNYCSHPQSNDFEVYSNNARQAGAKVDAADCAGFEDIVDYAVGDRHEIGT